MKYRVRFRDRFVSEPFAELKLITRAGSVALFEVMQGPFVLHLEMLVMRVAAPLSN